MKRHIISFLLISFTALLGFSCVDDPGNYDFADLKEVIPFSVKEFPDTPVTMGTTLSVYPQISGREPGKDYQYDWIMVGARFDTIAHTENLVDYLIIGQEGTYLITFVITDPDTGLKSITSMNINLTSEFYDGFYVLRDDNGMTDFDFVKSDGTQYEEVLLTLHGEKMPGTPEGLIYQPERYSHQYRNEDGTISESFTNLNVLRLFSDREMYNMDPVTFGIYKNYRESFYDPLPTPGFGGIYYDVNETDCMYIDNNLFYYRTSNISGIFSPPRVGDFELFPCFLTGDGITLFDNKSRSFITTGYWTDTFEGPIPPTPNDPVQMSPENMDYEMVRWAEADPMVLAGVYGSLSFSLMKNVNTGEYKVFRLYGGYNTPIRNIFDVPAGSGLANSVAFAPHGSLNYIYYSTGDNVMWMQTLGVGDVAQDGKVHTFPEGEKIVYIKHFNPTGYTLYDFNNLIVLTNDNSGWKLYRFEMVPSTHLFLPDPLYVNRGTGRAVCVDYRN